MLPRLLILFLCLQASTLFADEYIIDLHGSQVTSKLKGFHVERVINATSEPSCIGFVQRGAFNRQEAAFLKPTTSAAIEECLQRSFPPSSETKPLILRINKLYIWEITGSAREIACVELSVTFIVHDGDSYTEIFHAGDSFEKNGIDVTGYHEDNKIGRAHV